MSKNPKEVFVGNLSFFCGENDLAALFRPYANVLNVRVVLNHDHSKSLMYGFVRFDSVQEAMEIARLFRNHLFMGRRLRVTHVHNPPLWKNLNPVSEVTVHLSFTTTKQCNTPLEVNLRKFFLLFGSIDDVVVRDFAFNPAMRCYQGFAFLTFVEARSAYDLASSAQEFHCEGLLVRAALSYSSSA